MAGQERSAIVWIALSFVAWMGGNAILAMMSAEPMMVRLILAFFTYLFVLVFAAGVYGMRLAAHVVAPSNALARWGVIVVSCAVFGAAGAWVLQFGPIINLTEIGRLVFGGLITLVAIVAVALLDWLESPPPAPRQRD
jgi:hypothetical protein